MALLVGELYARITADNGDAKRQLREFDREADRVAGRTTASFGKMAKTIGLSMGGIGVAAMAAATVSGGALATIPLLFAGIAAAAVSSNKEVQDAWLGMAEHVSGAVRDDAAHLAGYYVEAANRIGGAFDVLRPQIARAMELSAPHVLTLTDGVTGLATQAMPGLLAAVEKADPAVEGLGVTLSRTGRGVGEMFREMAEAAPEAGQGLEHLGALTEGTLPPLGKLIADLTRIWGEHGDEVVAVITKLTSGIASFAGGVLPTLGDGLGLAAEGAGGLLDVVNSVIAGFMDLPAPVQAGVAAVVAWRLAQDRVTSGVSGLADRLVTPWRSFGDEMRVQQSLMAAQQRTVATAGGAYGSLADRINATTGVSRQAAAATNEHGAALAALTARSPTLTNMVAGYQRVAGETRAYADQAYRAGAASQSLGESIKGSALQAMAPFSAAANGAATAVGQGLKGAAAGLVGVLGGPWGVALTAGTALIATWMARSQAAAKQQQALAEAGKSVATAIREQNGVINENVRAVAAKRLEEQGLLAAAQRLGIPVRLLTNAFVDQGNASGTLKDRLQGIIDADTRLISSTQAKTGEVTGTTKVLGAQGIAAQDLMGKLDGLTGGLRAELEAQGRVAEATHEGTTAMYKQQPAVGVLAAALSTLGDTGKTSADKISDLKSALDGLTRDKHSMEEAVQAMNDSLRDLGKAFTDARTEAGKNKTGLTDHTGAINTATKAGSDLQNKVMEITGAMNGQVAAILANADATGKKLPDAAKEAAAAVQRARDAFLKSADGAKIAKDTALALADQYGLNPKIVETQILQPGMPQSLLDLILLKSRFDAVPNAKSIVTSALTDDAVQRLRDLGFRVTTLPNGQVRVELPNIGNARGQLNDLVETQVKQVMVKVTAGPVQYSDQVRRPGHSGGSLAHGAVLRFADGGMFGPGIKEMPAGTAGIVQSFKRTGFLRVIADNPKVPESYIPLDRNSRRSQMILDETLREMRPDLWAALTRGVLPMAAGGMLGTAGIPEQRGGRSVSYGDIHLHAVQSLPTVQQLRDLTHDLEFLHG